MLSSKVIPRFLVRWKAFCFSLQECSLQRERESVACRQQQAAEEGLLLPLASVALATCRKVKTVCF